MTEGQISLKFQSSYISVPGILWNIAIDLSPLLGKCHNTVAMCAHVWSLHFWHLFYLYLIRIVLQTLQLATPSPSGTDRGQNLELTYVIGNILVTHCFITVKIH